MSMDRPRPRATGGRRLLHAVAPVVAVAGPAVAAIALLLVGAAASLSLALREPDAGAAAPTTAFASPGSVTPSTSGAPVRPTSAGAVTVEVPEVYELANVVLALTEFTARQRHTVWRRGAYHDAVRAHFAPFRSHPLVARLNERLQGERAWYGFLSFREGSVALAFDGDRLVPSPSYPQRIMHGGPELFVEEAALVEDFARRSDFRAFYGRHRPYYASLVRQYEAEVPLARMWAWLERRFPERYDRYRVVFSPLVHGTHSTQRFDDGGERQTIMFVAGPQVVSDTLAPGLRAATLARIVFTEIDHNYVNPTTDRHLERVDAAFAAYEEWNADRHRMYASPYATFNEYMTWGVFLLYARDAFDPATFAALRQDVDRQMEGQRGFVRFGDFGARLLELYAAGASTPIAALYDPMLRWAAEHPRDGGR